MELEGMMVHRLHSSVSKIETWWYFISCSSLVLCVMLGTQWCHEEPFSAPSCRNTDRTGFCFMAQEAKQHSHLGFLLKTFQFQTLEGREECHISFFPHSWKKLQNFSMYKSSDHKTKATWEANNGTDVFKTTSQEYALGYFSLLLQLQLWFDQIIIFI